MIAVPYGSYFSVHTSFNESFWHETTTCPTSTFHMKKLSLLFAGLAGVFGMSLQAQSCVSVCPSQGLSTAFEWIRTVDVGPIFNNSGDNGGYADFGTSFGGTFSAGSTIGYSVQAGYGDGPFSETWRGWMDLNQDGDFDDAGELVFSNFGQGVVSGTLSIPATAFNGLTKFRIAMSFAVPPECGDFPEGEVEDYCVTITGGVAPSCDASSPVTGLSAAVDSTEILLSWNPVNLSVGCQVSGGIVPSLSQKKRILGANVASVSIPISVLTPGTYNWKVNCACAISPTPILTPDSAIDTFVVPAVRMAAKATQNETQLRILGNPVQGLLQIGLHVGLQTAVAGEKQLLVTDMLGRNLIQATVPSFEGANRFDLNVSQLPFGSYVLVVMDGQGRIGSMPFFKQ